MDIESQYLLFDYIRQIQGVRLESFGKILIRSDKPRSNPKSFSALSIIAQAYYLVATIYIIYSSIHLSISSMSTPALGLAEDSASEAMDIPAVQAARRTPVPPTSFFSLPRELRDMIYAYLFEAIYTQCKGNAHLTLAEIFCASTPPEAEISDRLAIMQASRRLWDEGSTMLYCKHVFCFHVGSIPFDATFLTQRTANLMQDIEINLSPSKFPDSVRILQLFGDPQILRNSCLVKLKFRKPELIGVNVIEALKQLTGFELLAFEMEAPPVVRWKTSGTLIPWVSGLLAHIKAEMQKALGPSTYDNIGCYRRLIFEPQYHRKKEERKTKITMNAKRISIIRQQ